MGDAGRHIVLVGMMGAGKTTVGRRVAKHLGRPFFDSDRQVEARTGRTVAQIFETDGEATFRRLEAEVLAEGLASSQPAVIAAAGGVVLDPENRRRLKESGTVVWLRARPSTLAGRVQSGTHRPLLKVDPVGVLTRLVEERKELYEEVADAIVDIDEIPPGKVVDAVLDAVGNPSS